MRVRGHVQTYRKGSNQLKQKMHHKSESKKMNAAVESSAPPPRLLCLRELALAHQEVLRPNSWINHSHGKQLTMGVSWGVPNLAGEFFSPAPGMFFPDLFCFPSPASILPLPFHAACYLQHFGAGTCHFACYFQHFGAEPSMLHAICSIMALELFILHAICRIWAQGPSIYHAVCRICAQEPFSLRAICKIRELEPSMLLYLLLRLLLLCLLLCCLLL